MQTLPTPLPFLHLTVWVAAMVDEARLVPHAVAVNHHPAVQVEAVVIAVAMVLLNHPVPGKCMEGWVSEWWWVGVLCRLILTDKLGTLLLELLWLQDCLAGHCSRRVASIWGYTGRSWPQNGSQQGGGVCVCLHPTKYTVLQLGLFPSLFPLLLI